MATPKAAWGIEIGAYAIKAIRLERNGEDIAVSDFAVIPHKKVLTTPDLDQDEMVRLGLGQFISQKSLEGEHLVMSVPGHAAFARFAKLPPVEPKKVPDIVKFEAVQQIPFPIDEVEWDYETFASPDTPEIEVGIFAITRERVQQRLGLYAEVGLSPEAMTLSPVAVYSAMRYDLGEKLKGPVIFLDIGTSATDVIIAEEGRCWIRTFPLGGTHFTEAIASAFKLSYSKAEKLKLEAADSKYAKQIMQAMRPVFSDLLNDLKRSIDYYKSTHRESEVGHMVGVGSTFKIPGLRKFLGQQLDIEVQRLDEYRKVQVTGREAAAFAENAVNMATAYGLALQGVGLAKINANLVPVKTLREQMWHGKTKWFAAAAVVAILASAATMVRPMLDRSRMAPTAPPIVEQVINRGNSLKQEFEAIRASADQGDAAQTMLGLFDHRTVWPYLLHDVSKALASSDPQPELLSDKLDLILGIDPKQRRLIQLNNLTGDYRAPAAGQPRRIAMMLVVELTHENPRDFLNETIAKWLRENAEPTGARADVPYRILTATVSTNPTSYEEVEINADGGETVLKPGERPTAPPGIDPGGGGDPSGMPQPQGAPLEVPRISGEGAGFVPGGEGTISGPGFGAGGGPTRGGGAAAPPQGLPRDPRSGSMPGDLSELAPVPVRPQIYPPKTRLFRAPITFEVELIDKKKAPSQIAGSPQESPAS